MTQRDDPFDLDKFRSTPEELEAYAAARRVLKKSKTHGAAAGSGRDPFVQYPVAAIVRLAGARHLGTVKLFGWLLHLSWKADHRLPLKIASKAVAPLGLTRWSKGAALRELETLGLIRVERRARRSPWSPRSRAERAGYSSKSVCYTAQLVFATPHRFGKSVCHTGIRCQLLSYLS